MGSRKGIKQEKNKRSGEVLDKVERIYSGRQYLGGKENLKNAEKLIEELNGEK